ncbi:hypothetical protein LSH36_1034g00073, partial [Paralvinella palmiformis]
KTTVSSYVPEYNVISKDTNLFNENVISHFSDILKRREKQISMDRFVARRKFEPKVSESEPSVEPEVVELATELELEIVSVKPSTSLSDKEKEKKVEKQSV